MAMRFKGAHFSKDVILTGVRWYGAYPRSMRYADELMEERGVTVDVLLAAQRDERAAKRFLAKAIRRHGAPVGS